MSLSSTVSLAGAAAQWDAVVVGGGPAGAVAARELARRGVKTLLVDKADFPRAKVCGCCLNGAALTSLQSIGLSGLVERLGGVPLKAVRLAAGGRSATINWPGGVALSREAFDAALVQEAITAGADFLPGTTAKRSTSEEDARSNAVALRLRQAEAERTIAARVVIVAAGLGGRLDASAETANETATASRIGAGVVVETANRFFEAGKVFMAVGRGGYVGMVRLEDGRLDAAAAFDPAFVRDQGGLGLAAASVVDEAGFPILDGLTTAPWRGTPALTRSAKQLAGERWFAVGDAAGYVEPFTGEGMAWALASAAAVAPLAAAGVQHWDPQLIGNWERSYAKVVHSRQATCRAAAAVLRSPWLSRLAVKGLAILPILSRPVVGALHRPAALVEQSP